MFIEALMISLAIYWGLCTLAYAIRNMGKEG